MGRPSRRNVVAHFRPRQVERIAQTMIELGTIRQNPTLEVAKASARRTAWLS